MRPIHALTLLLIPLLLTACANEKIVERPVPYEVVNTEYVPVPEDLTAPVDTATIPDSITYGDALILWAQDRAAIARLNAQLEAIREITNAKR